MKIENENVKGKNKYKYIGMHPSYTSVPPLGCLYLPCYCSVWLKLHHPYREPLLSRIKA